MLDFEDYVTKLAYPNKVHRPTKPMSGAKSHDYRAYADLLEQYEAAKTIYDVLVAAYQEDVAKLANQFRVDALVDLGIADHPAAQRAYGMAYDRCHSDGLAAVYYELLDLASLMIPTGWATASSG